MDNSIFEIRNGELISYSGDPENVIIPEGVRCIADDIFFDKTAARVVTLPASFEDAGGWMYVKSTVEQIKISERNPYMKMIGDSVYSMDGAVLLMYPPFLKARSFEVPDHVKEIGEGAFYGSRLERIVCNHGLVRIGVEAFMISKKLKEIVFSDTVKEIGKDAFAGCDALKSITLPARVKFCL